jgi:hypothetical protein
MSVPSVLFISILLILLACAVSSGFDYIHSSIGLLSQVFTLIVYCSYFVFDEIIPDGAELKGKMNNITYSVLTGTYDSGKV